MTKTTITNTEATSPVLTKVAELITPIVADMNLDIYDLEFVGGTLRVTVDSKPGQPAGVSLDTIALITRLIGREFDHSDPIPGHYTLEVTSPGLERNLRTSSHFQREIGKEVAVRLAAAQDGHRRMQGLLVSATATDATLLLNDEQIEITFPLNQVERAKTVFVWGPTPKTEKLARGSAKKARKSNKEIVTTPEGKQP